MIELTAEGEGESYEQIARMVTDDLGTTALPTVVELRFGYAGDAGGFLANPRHIQVLNTLFAEQVPPFRVSRAMFAPGGDVTDSTIALKLDSL